MSYFYLARSWPPFKGFEEGDSRVGLLGVGFDSTASYKPGTRFAPRRIREVSLELEDYLPLFNAYTSSIKIRDLGDLDVAFGDAEETLRRVTVTVGEMLGENLVPVVIGGEHTITLGILRAFKRPVDVVVVDAHLDARDEYPSGIKTSHATLFRRAIEEGLVNEVVYLGARAFTQEEENFVKRRGRIYTPLTYSHGLGRVEEMDELYLSIDLDGLDPSQAPGVGNVEPGGIFFNDLLSLFKVVSSKKIIGADIVEVNPLVDVNDVTSALAAKIIEYIIYLIAAEERAQHP